jgi:hypothetical protein
MPAGSERVMRNLQASSPVLEPAVSLIPMDFRYPRCIGVVFRDAFTAALGDGALAGALPRLYAA